ncbi:sulfatase [Ulvibacterium sp.]|uniref:sulfatase n=1 Tax=Ulvibacterium sp. TaxID=2665914 RepID=UPI003BAD3A72
MKFQGFKKIVQMAMGALLLMACQGLVIAQEKPNIVILFIDDYGYMDIGYRNAIFQTPNLDQLKKEGMDFTRAYIPTPTCSPSRASLLTGKEAVRMQMVRHIPPNNGGEFSILEKDPAQMPTRNWLPLKEVTYAETLKKYGYYNAFFGKWHLGEGEHYPQNQGFDEVYGATDAGHPQSYYYPFFKDGQDPKGYFAPSMVNKGDYLTDVLTDNAVDFIDSYDKDQPFVLTFWYYSVHGPSIGRKDLLAKYQKQGLEGKYAHHAAMVEAMDESVGRVRQALEDKGIADNTVVILISDQGGAYSNAPFRGGKKGGDTLAEGGARVPMIVYYPGVTQANSICETPVQSIDVYPTLVEIASGEKCKEKQINGKSLMPLLRLKKTKERPLFFFRSYEDQYTSVIRGDWKLIKYRSGKFQLYNLENDTGETTNLVTTHPTIAKKLKKCLAKWEKEAVPTY